MEVGFTLHNNPTYIWEISPRAENDLTFFLVCFMADFFSLCNLLMEFLNFCVSIDKYSGEVHIILFLMLIC